MTLAHLFGPRAGDTVRFVRADQVAGEEPYRTEAGVFLTDTQDVVADWERRLSACLVPAAATDRSPTPWETERPDFGSLADEIRAARDAMPVYQPEPVTYRELHREHRDAMNRRWANVDPATIAKITVDEVGPTITTDADGTMRASTTVEHRLQYAATDKNEPIPTPHEQPETTHNTQKSITGHEPRNTSPHTTSPSPAETPDEAPDNPGHTPPGHHREGGGSR